MSNSFNPQQLGSQLVHKLRATPAWSREVLLTLVALLLVASALGIGFLNSNNAPTGGDAGSHLLYAWLYSENLFLSGSVVPWVPEVFAGFPFLSYYFPLPFIVIALISKLIGVASAFKWGGFLAAMLLPGAVFVGSRRWLKFGWTASLFGALGALSFLLHEQNSIWGGNLLSTLAGEFAYSYGMLFLVLAMFAWSRAIFNGKGWVLAGVLEACCGFSHGFPLLVVGFSTLFLVYEGKHFKRNIVQLLCGHVLAFCLLGGWLWPMIEMHSLTVPNDGSFPVGSWHELLPTMVWFTLAAGVAGLALLAFPSVRRSWGAGQIQVARYFASTSGLAAVAFVAGSQLGLADIRFFPMTWLLGGIVCGWLFGQAVASLCAGEDQITTKPKLAYARVLVILAACSAQLGWISEHVAQAPDWGLWNHSGLEAKPQWHNLSQLFPHMEGNLWSTRLVFEHDPDNNDIGSTRTLEALPMFLKHRPVLEGLYMESAVLGPAIYQLQSEVSARPSSPLSRFPSGSLDPVMAAKHMNYFHADTLLLRSPGAKDAIAASGLFDKVAESSPFALYRLKHFDSHIAEVVTKPITVYPEKDWMQRSFFWFRSNAAFDASQPVFGADSSMPKDAYTGPGSVHAISLSRHEMVFETEAIGRPHLIKIAYHPRWHLESKGKLNIAAPGFIMVTPEEREIRLVYGHTTVGKLGIAATTLGFLFLAFALWRRRQQLRAAGAGMQAENASPAAMGFLRSWIPVLLAWLFLLGGGLYFYTHSPEGVYQQGWELMRAEKFEQAANKFKKALGYRKSPAQKEEALFWLAKANDLSGHRVEAKAALKELCDNYMGYWLPESMFILASMEQQDGHTAEAAALARRLRDEYPNSQWSQKLSEQKL